MRVYWEVAKRGYRRRAAYRAAMVAGLFTNTVFAFIKAYVLLALYRNQDVVGGFTATDTVTFVFASEALLAATSGLYMWDDIALRIRTGDVVTDLYRPVDFQSYWLADDFGRGAYHLVTRGVAQLVIGAMVFHLTFPPVVRAPAIACSLVLAIAISFGIRFLVNLCAFWLIDIRGLNQLSVVLQAFLTGMIVPLVFYPAWLEAIARALPFAWMVQVPAEIFMGKHTGAALALTLLAQAAWAVALAGLGRVAMSAAMRKVVIQGG